MNTNTSNTWSLNQTQVNEMGFLLRDLIDIVERVHLIADELNQKGTAAWPFPPPKEDHKVEFGDVATLVEKPNGQIIVRLPKDEWKKEESAYDKWTEWEFQMDCLMDLLTYLICTIDDNLRHHLRVLPSRWRPSDDD